MTAYSQAETMLKIYQNARNEAAAQDTVEEMYRTMLAYNTHGCLEDVCFGRFLGRMKLKIPGYVRNSATPESQYTLYLREHIDHGTARTSILFALDLRIAFLARYVREQKPFPHWASFGIASGSGLVMISLDDDRAWILGSCGMAILVISVAVLLAYILYKATKPNHDIR